MGARGGTTIVNGERVPGPPVTLELQDVSEQQALDIVLRGVSGYLVAPRETAVAGASAFDRIFILPTSSRPTNASALPQPPQQQALQQIQDDWTMTTTRRLALVRARSTRARGCRVTSCSRAERSQAARDRRR